MMKIEESGHTWDTEVWGGRTEDAAAPPPPWGRNLLTAPVDIRRIHAYPPLSFLKKS